MKFTFLFVLTAAFATTSASAQTIRNAASPSPAVGPPVAEATSQQVAAQVRRITQELGLSAEQQARLRQVLLLTRQHMDADRTAHQGDPAALQAAMAFDRAKSDELIREVLTPAQYTRYQQNKAARIGQLHTVAH